MKVSTNRGDSLEQDLLFKSINITLVKKELLINLSINSLVLLPLLTLRYHHLGNITVSRTHNQELTLFFLLSKTRAHIFAFFSAFGVTVGSVEFKTSRAGLILTVVQFKL